MLFNSMQFVLFFPAAVLVYFLIPYRYRNYWLLAMSYFYYMCWRPEYAMLLLASTVVTYAGGLLMGRKLNNTSKNNRHKKAIVIVSVLLNLGLLGFFKYFDFIFDAVSDLAGVLGITVVHPQIDILLPVGISFYIFQALSYTMDVYRGEVEPERDFFKYALFVSFFPQLVAGPIERSKNLLKQFDEKHDFDYDRVRSGLLRMLWGFFLKLVLEVRLATVADLIYGNYKECTGYQLLLGTVIFAFQIYCDFAGYSEIAIGAAKVMGFSLMENFRQPFLSASCKELWNRWHISLNTWFRDYLYFPLGGSRKGKFRRYVNLMIVFAVSGLWHGADWTFVIWGALSGLFQILGDLLAPARKALGSLVHLKEGSRIHRVLCVVCTFMLFCVSLVFFRATCLDEALVIMTKIFTGFNFASILATSPFSLGLGVYHLLILALGLIILFAVDLYRNGGKTLDDLFGNNRLLRWGMYYLLVTLILLSANFGAQEFIYFRF